MVDQLKEKVTIWVKKVLEDQRYENIEVKLENNQQKGGHLSDLIPIEVNCRKNGKAHSTLHLLVKKGKVDPIAIDVLNLKNIYKNEITLYSKILPYFHEFSSKRNVKKFDNIPISYGTIEETNEYVIFIENLKHREFHVHEIESTHDLEHTKLVLETYARWHALSFASKDQEVDNFEKLLSGRESRRCGGFGNNSKMFDYMINSIREELNTVISIFVEKNYEREKIEKLEKLRDKIREMYGEIDDMDEKYMVIRHGDCWNNNYLFHYKTDGKTPDKVVVIDWQLAILGSPVLDIALYLFHCCSKKVLKHLDDLLEFYYRTLSNKIEELGSKSENCFPKRVFLDIFKEKCAGLAFSGTPVMARMSCKFKSDQEYDITTAEKEGNFGGITAGELRDPEGYLERINGILELCMEKGYL